MKTGKRAQIAQNRTPKKGTKGDFLAAYVETCSISRAAVIANIARRTHYDWLAADEKYKADFQEIQEQAAQTLEDEAIRRAYAGIEKPVTIAGKREVIREYSDTLLIFLLKGLRPEKYRERSEVRLPELVNLVDRLAAGRKRAAARRNGEPDGSS